MRPKPQITFHIVATRVAETQKLLPHTMDNSQKSIQPKKIVTVGANSRHKSPIRRQHHNSSSYITSTAPLDEAMKELLDMCQQYTEELSIGQISVQSDSDKNDQEQTSIKKNDNTTKPQCDTNNHLNGFKSLPNSIGSNNNKEKNFDSIERLQQKQSELQLQLDDVLQVAKELESRQVRKLNCILEEQDDQEVSQVSNNQKLINNRTYDDDGDDELIEFQMIENELRISELNRQLDHIQEELRLRLYKRLLSNTTNRTRLEQQNSSTNNHSDNRRGSYPDETSPSSSSCSDEASTSTTSISHKTTTTTSTTIARIQAPKVMSLSIRQNALPSMSEAETSWDNRIEEGKLERSQANKELPNEEQLDGLDVNNEFLSNYNKDTDELVSRETTADHITIGGATDSTTNDYEVLNPTTSQSLVITSKRNVFEDKANIYGNTSSVMGTSYASQTCASNSRNSSGYSDLERIEEDEEDGQDGYYGNSNHFRTIYEEKLSPIIYDRSMSTLNDKHLHLEESNNDSGDYMKVNSSFENQPMQYNNLLKPATTGKTRLTPSNHQDERFNSNSFCGDNSFSDTSVAAATATILTTPPSLTSMMAPITTAKSVICTNRPLTLYLPKPHEEIDLVEHIQALGHDLNIISSDLKLDSVSAYGYLWKCCSNNSKKWLKRYFHFDRKQKALSYYGSRSDLVKKNSSPKNSVPFDEINDVYVDHKLSGIGEKDRSSKRHYVFVLATEARKYLLASSRAETMRAWIDILFTAAKASDYFQQQDNTDEADNDDPDHQDTSAYGRNVT